MAGEFSLGDAILGTEIDLSGLRAGLDQARGEVGSSFDQIGNLIGGALVTGLAAAGAAFVGLGVAGTQAFIGFDAQMREVFTLLPGISANAMAQMTDQIKGFSDEFGVLPDQAIPALYQALSAGVPQNNVFDFLATAEQAAVGGVTELETAVNGISSVVNAYGPSVLSATQASDQMFTAVRLGKTTFSELSDSLYNVIPTAASIGIQFGDVTAALAAMTAQGVPTSVATTQLRQLFVELSKDGSQVAAIFEKVAGVSFRQFIAEGGNVQQALQILEAAAQGSGKNISDLFSSVEAGNAALALTGQGAQMFTTDLAAMETSAGATAAAYATMDDSISRNIDKLRAGFSTFLIDIGGKLAPTFDTLTSVVLDAMPSVEGVVLGTFDAIGNALNIVTTTVLPALAGAWQLIAPAVTAAETVLLGVGNVFDGLMQQAAVWGYGIVSQLASGLLAAASEVVAALQDIGSIITDLLEPHSPPKLLPNIDDWGTETMRIWAQGLASGWDASSFGLFDQISGSIEQLLRSFASTGDIGQTDLIGMIFGSRDAVAQAISEIEQTGNVSAATMAQIQASAGPAAQQVTQLVQAYAAAQQASKSLTDAQANLDAITKQYDERIGGLTDQLDTNKQASSDLDEQERLLRKQPVVSADELDAIEAKRELLRRQRREIEDQIAQAKRERDSAVAAAKAKVDAAKKALSITQDQVKQQQALIRLQQEQNKLLAEQNKQQEKSGGGGSEGLDKAERDAKAAAEAQWAYNYAIADTDTKLAMMREKLAGLKPEQAEYWRVSGQITNLEKDKKRELDATTKAQQDYAYQTADTAGKLAILREKLGTLNKNQVEYWQTLGQIASLEDQANKHHAAGARALGGVSAAGIAAGRAVAGLQKPIDATAMSMDTLSSSTNMTAITVSQQSSTMSGAVSSAFGGTTGAISGFLAQVGGVVATLIGMIGDTTIPAIETLWSKIQVGVGNLTPIWDAFLITLGKLEPLVLALTAGVGAVLIGAFNALVGLLSGAIPGAFMLVSGIISAFLGVVNLIADVVMGVASIVVNLLQGNFSAAWNAAGQLVYNVVQDILQVVGGLFAAAIGLIGGLIGGIIGFFTELYNTLVGHSIVPDMVNAIIMWVSGLVGQFLALISGLKDGAILLFENLKAGATQKIDEMKAGVVSLVEGLITTISGLASRFMDAARGIGSAILDGISSAITRGADSMIRALVGAAMDALDAAKNALGIASPSKLAYDELGKPIPDAVALAFGDSAPMLSSALDNMMMPLTQPKLGLGSPLSAQGGALGGTTGQAEIGITVRFDDRGLSWLRQFVQLEISQQNRQVGGDVGTRRRTR